MKKVMVLGGSYLQLPLIEEINKRGYFSIVVDYDENCEGFKIASKKLLFSTQDIDSIDRYVAENPIDAIITIATDRPMLVVSKISEKYGLISTSHESANLAIKKNLMRAVLHEKKVSVPEFRVVNNIEDYFKAIKSLEYYKNLVVKATDNSGKKGVTKINVTDDRKSLELAFYYAQQNSTTAEVVVEEQLFGSEFSVEAITYKGKTEIIAITSKINSGEPHFVELGHFQPADINYADYLKMVSLVSNAIEALGLDNTGTHTEVMLTNQGPYIIEVGPRLGGDNISTKLTKTATGIDMVDLILNISLGLEIKYNFSRINYCYIYYFDKPIRKDVIEKAISKESIVDLRITRDTIFINNVLMNSSERYGYVIVKANSKKGLELLVKKVKRL